MGEEMRWLTVSPSDQPDLEIVLMPAKARMCIWTERKSGGTIV